MTDAGFILQVACLAVMFWCCVGLIITETVSYHSDMKWYDELEADAERRHKENSERWKDIMEVITLEK